MDSLSDAKRVLSRAHARPALLDGGRLIRVDGPAGSGKTTFAAALSYLRPEAVVIHMDDLYEGWDGLEAGMAQLRTVVKALAQGHPAIYHRFDWTNDDYAEAVTVGPAPLVVVEGVGAGIRDLDRWSNVLVWVEAPPEQRLQRGLTRDGEALRPQWEQFAREEQALFAVEHTRERADVIVDTSD